MKGSHDIYVIKVGNEYRVRPAVWSSDAQGGQPELKIRNLTDKRVLVVLPVEILANTIQEKNDLNPARQANDPLAKDRVKVILKGKGKDDAGGAYPYSVFVYTADGWEKAVGESEPVVIIDPPPA